ncbi:MAG: prepilin-type N-terminal cleavage/methylation domain-containing protein [Bacilli bacterium]|nr:prepilin-type N-terminal cleavage/methylation domain-containing protein [Bacilli bacterium]MDD4795254.1 prepilin-type N-terminal cleavage/methylation domain-containing protein [Bacilli bacterium]
MKNNKGFTLVEVLVVIVILGIILTIGYSAISSSIAASRKKTNELTIANIKDASLVFAQEMYICDDTSNILTILRTGMGLTSIKKCLDAKNALVGGITVPLRILEQYEYITKTKKCDGDIEIYFDCSSDLNEDCKRMTNLKVSVEDITCN